MKAKWIGTCAIVGLVLGMGGLAYYLRKPPAEATEVEAASYRRVPGMMDLSKPWTRFQDMHDYYINAFVLSDGFGNDRVPALYYYKGTLFESNGQRYGIRRLELIGLLKHPTPVVYENQRPIPQRNQLADTKTRPLTELETKAVEQLKAGSELVHHFDRAHPILIGAMRANKASCIQCHEVPRGTLLGAFVYELDPTLKENFPAEPPAKSP